MAAAIKKRKVTKKPLTKEFVCDVRYLGHAGHIKAVYHAPIKMWKLYKRNGNAWRLLGAVRGTEKTTDKNMIAKLPKEATKKATAKKKPLHKKNPLKKYVFFVGPQFPDTEKGKRDCTEFAQRFANKYGVVGHVYKA